MGKRIITNELNLDKMLLPGANRVLDAAAKMLGAERILANCQGGIVLVSPWAFQTGKRGDTFWRYARKENEWLRSHGYPKKFWGKKGEET